jgi:hypothetical protein
LNNARTHPCIAEAEIGDLGLSRTNAQDLG